MRIHKVSNLFAPIGALNHERRWILNMNPQRLCEPIALFLTIRPCHTKICRMLKLPL